MTLTGLALSLRGDTPGGTSWRGGSTPHGAVHYSGVLGFAYRQGQLASAAVAMATHLHWSARRTPRRLATAFGTKEHLGLFTSLQISGTD